MMGGIEAVARSVCSTTAVREDGIATAGVSLWGAQPDVRDNNGNSYGPCAVLLLVLVQTLYLFRFDL